MDTKDMSMLLISVLFSWIWCFHLIEGQFSGNGVVFHRPFCHQFFANSQKKTPLEVSVLENAAVGTILRTFEKPTITAHMRVTGGPLRFFDFDTSKLELSVKQPLLSLRGQTLQLNTSCVETMQLYKLEIKFSPSFMITVRDVNDPPVFVNLPGTVTTEEAVPHQRIIYKAVGDDPYDVDDVFKRKWYRLVNVTAVGTDEHASQKFSVDRQGNVIINGGVDYDKGPRQYNLVIEVIDGGFPPLKNQSVLTVLLEDSDDQGPAFQYDDYTATVIGEKPIMEVECQVTVPPLFATDQDPVKKSPINYRIISGDPGDYRYWSTFFYVDSDTGRLCQSESVPRSTSRASRRLERKGFHNFTFTVQAYQTDDPRKAATTRLFVHVQDRNIHAPQFRRLRYRTSLLEYPATHRGAIVLTVEATDDDYGMNKLLKYELVDNPRHAFSIDAHSGLVRVMRPRYIDRDANSTMEISVRAVESHTVDRFESKQLAKIEVSILDVNDNPPRFTQEKYEYIVKDNHPVGMAINNASNKVEATDLDFKENGTVTYTIGQVTNSFGRFSIKDLNRFVVDAKGNIRIGRSLRDLRRNREFPYYTLRINAEDQATSKSERLSSSTTVIIRIVEANDFPPNFVKVPTSVVIGESAEPGTLIANMKALDKDGDEDMYLQYQIAEGNVGSAFSISNRGYLVTARPLDREQTADYTLVVQVTDRVHTVNATVRVHLKDENDHAPAFQKSRYDLSIPENVMTRLRIGDITADDPDDGANGRVTYKIVGGDMPHLFSISWNGTLYLVRKDHVVDREVRDKFILTVEASDGGTPPKTNITEVNVHLLDVNDNAPEFVRSTYRASVVEGPNSRRLKMLGVIRARDNDKTVENRNIRFSLSGLGNEVFEINELNGRLRVKSPEKIDCESQCRYFLKVIARDRLGKGLQSSSDLIISVEDINDNRPEFLKNYTFRVGPLTKKGTLVGKIEAKDRDVSPQNHRVIYLLRGGGVGKFHVDFISGDLVVSDELLRDPIQEIYTLSVEAHDTGQPRQMATTNVTLFVPISKPPVIDVEFEFSVFENLTVGAVAGTLRASDPDIAKGSGEKLEYFIRNQKVPFIVDKITGDIRTYQALDREDLAQYVFQAYVKDNGLPAHTATTTVTVNLLDVNDNAPEFGSSRGYHGSITEDDEYPKYQEVEMIPPVSAEDADVDEIHRNIRYSLSGDGHEMFEINPHTGEIRVKTKGSIDCETKCFYELKVMATDMNGTGLTSESALNISIHDVNDNKPEFRGGRQFNAGRLAPMGTVVGDLNTVDRDIAHKNNRILHFLRAGGLGKFSVDVETGKITVADYLTREPMKEVYTLEVEAHDTGEPKLSSTATVKITVTLNTEPITAPSVSLEVLEHVMVNSPIGHIKANDPDNEDGVIQKLEYYIQDESALKCENTPGRRGDVGNEPCEPVPFTIEAESGRLKTSSSIDRETTDGYEFIVLIRDDGVPPFTASTTVTVTIIDINDNPPVFDSEYGYTGTVSEDDTNPKERQKVLVMPQIVTSDADATEENRMVRYSLHGNGSEMFTIDHWNGTIQVSEPGSIDCEMECLYNLTVSAIDKNGKGFRTDKPMIISVLDENDNAPVFEQNQYFNTHRLTPGGTIIGQIRATDSDKTSPNNRINFHLRKGGYGKFSVDLASGNITVSDSLLREPMREEYKLFVEAHDSGNPSLSAGIQVTVAVPLNHKPYLPPLTQFSVIENIVVGTDVGQIIAKDEDIAQNKSQQLTYFIGKTTAFVMDEETGVIRTNVDIDREKEDQFVLEVFVKDSGIPSFTSTGTVVINVVDQNDNVPEFSQPGGYEGHITEDYSDLADKQKVKLNAPILATDVDATEENRKLHYRLEGDGSEEFEINETTAEINVKNKGGIDCERKCLYNLMVVAYDEGDNSSSSAVNLTITVEDVNDNTPEFMEGLEFQTGRLTTPGETVGELHATDADFSERNNKIIFLLREGGYGKFAVNVETGEILVSDDLTRPPMKEVYELVVEAFDNGNPQLSSVAEIRIHVTLNTPPSVPPGIQVLLQENIPIGTFVTQVKAIDPDIGKNPDDYLDFYMNDKTVPFVIDVVDGTVRTSREIDRESQDTYKFLAYVRDHGVPAYTVSSSVTVKVKDINDNAPVFGSAIGYNGTVTEDDSRPIPMQEVMVMPSLVASDNDSTEANRNLTFSLKGNGSELFLMDRKSGQIRVKKAGQIDCETKCRFHLQIVAADSGGDGIATETNLTLMVEDTNDNVPTVIEKPVFTTGRGAALGTSLGYLLAKDDDFSKRNNKILFYLKEGGFQKFAVDFYTGEVITTSNLTRSPMREEYKLLVELYDTGEPQLSSTTEVFIKVPRNSPPTVDSELNIGVTENGPAGEVIGRVMAQDADVGKVPGETLQYILDPKSALPPFNVNSSSGEIVSIISHDRELVDSYVFVVLVSDNGLPSYTATTTVHVAVQDQNDHVPVFGSENGYQGSVIEDNNEPILNQRLIVIPEIHVSDKDRTEENQNVRFSLLGEGSELFVMDPESGQIQVKEPGTIDCETWSDFDLKIVATDRSGNGHNATSSLKVTVEDLNDNAPKLEPKYRFAVGRLTPVGTAVGLVTAEDNDVSTKNNRVHYSITGGSGSGRFSVDLNSGNIRVTTALTTQPMRDQYTLNLEAYDTGNPPLAAVTKVLVDVPLNTPPKVPPYFYLTIYENQDPGTFVGNVSAYDPDVKESSKERLHYTFNASAVPFALNKTSGLIKTARILDREVENQFIFPVMIADNGAPPFTVTTTVTVNVWDQNDNYPVFNSERGYTARLTENDNSESYENSVSVNPPILATDLDKLSLNKNILYRLSGPGSNLFTMNPVTASVQLSGEGPINCEDQCLFNLQVTATDRNGTGLQTTTNLTIYVEDVNDNAPKFVQEYEFRLQRYLPVGTTIGSVKALDQDVTTKNNRVLYNIKQGSHGDFEIDLMTGEVRVANSLLREPHIENYLLELEAVDTGNPQLSAKTKVKINVPKNHAPLLQSFFEFSVDENLPTDTEVGQVVADDYDVDVSDAQNLHYWIKESVPFTVDSKSGIIQTQEELDRESKEQYIFRMYVKDDGVPPFTASTTVRIVVNDLNDNAPEFGSLRGYKARITEDDTLSVGVQEVDLLPALVVKDADKTKANRNIRYSLKGKGWENFNISPLTGQIHAKYRQIDCETRCRYILDLVATDKGGNGTSSMTKILVEVEDVNDNPPMVPGVYAFTTPRLSPVGLEVGRIQAIDRDWTKKNSRLLYYLKDGGQGKFAVNISSGSVYVNTPLVTSPMLEQYVLHVEVYDTGEPQLWGLTEVIINVPLNKPPTIPPQYNFTTPENRELGDIIGEVKAEDPDLIFNPSEVLSYYVNDSRLPFTPDLHTGVLRTTGSIDLEEDDHFRFVLYVSDNGIPPFTATTTVRVQVLDENDHYPLFNSIGGYTATLDEDDQQPRTNRRIAVTPRIMVSDGDETPENGDVRFWLTGQGVQLFEIDPVTAELFVTEPGNIDCETQCRFDFKIVAGDQQGMGLESTENLVIHVEDVNDNRPEFPHNYSFSVPRDSAIGSPVGTVKAVDKDVTSRNSRILYSIKSSSRGDFVVNIQTGEIVVANSLFLDPQKEDYTLVLEGTDTGDPPLSAEAIVKIYVPMNHPPVVDEEISFAVPEKIPIGAMIGEIVVNDIDIGSDENQYLIYNFENDKVPFLINSTTGVITTTGELDSEQADKHIFEVFIRDNGDPEQTVSSLITIFVTDVNDNAPVFGSKKGYRGLVTEDNWIPFVNQEVTVIPPISAVDLDSSADNNAIRFRLEGPGKDTFHIDPRSGELTIQKPGTIDCEKMCLYQLQVIAEDGEGLTSQANLSISVEDVNDHAPEFGRVEDFYVASTTSVGAVVGQFQAQDLDQSTRNNRVMYHLKGGGHGKFSVDVDSGDIVVADSLIREPLMENYVLHIEAYDTGEPRLSAEAEVMVSVAMNHAPSMDIFYEYEIRETVSIGTVVGTITVIDPDQNQTLEYFMDDASVPFRITPDKGVIKTTERLDRETHEEHVFMVYAKDDGTPPYTASSIVTIFLEDVNDNAPIFTNGHSYHGYVIEDDFNPKIGQKIQLDKNVSVADMDASEENRGVVLSLEGEGSELFVIDRYTGRLSTAKPGTIDRERAAIYNLQIAATDQNGEGLSRRSHLVISVVDENDHPPVFEKPKFLFTLNHLAKAGYEVGHVKAYDPDATKPNNELLYVLQDDPFGKFKLDVRTGKLYLLESFFAKPRRDEYVIQVSVIDMGFPAKTAYTEVVVKSTGMLFNDFPPEFLGRTMFYLQEETPVGTLVGKLNIIDKDKNNGGGMNISIEGEDARLVPFSVDNDGNIRTTARIDRDAGYFYFLFNVRATDTGSPPLNTSQEIGVIMEDINDNPPEFTLRKYRHMVYDLFPPHTVVATPFAHDSRDTTTSIYHYEMTGGRPGYFFIDRETGEVKTTRNIERLGKETITYTVKATDLYNRALTATATLEIQILDSFSNATCCCVVPC